MTATAPTLTEEAGGGDPDGSGAYHPQGDAPNRHVERRATSKAVVKGTFPHGVDRPGLPVRPGDHHAA